MTKASKKMRRIQRHRLSECKRRTKVKGEFIILKNRMNSVYCLEKDDQFTILSKANIYISDLEKKCERMANLITLLDGEESSSSRNNLLEMPEMDPSCPENQKLFKQSYLSEHPAASVDVHNIIDLIGDDIF
jgi:hypothetical protein